MRRPGLLLALGLGFLGEPAFAATLSITVGGTNPGTVGVIPIGQLCSGAGTCVYQVAAGTQVRIVANSPGIPGVISGGTGDAAACGTSICSFTMNNNSSLNVNFNPGAFPSLSIVLAGDGVGEVGADNSRCENYELEPSSCTVFYAAGSQVTMDGRSVPSNLFVNFSGGTSGAAGCSTSPCVFTLSTNATVIANFAALNSVSVSPPSATREAGEVQVYSAAGSFTGGGSRPLVAGHGSWSNKPTLAVARYSSVGVAAGDRLYLLGGIVGDSPSTRVDRFDPSTGMWTQRQSMPTAHSEFAGAALGGMIYAVGGRTTGGLDVATVEAYDPVGNSWTPKTALPAARSDHAAAALDGFLYAVGGGQNAQPPVASLDAYDPGANTWTPKAPMPTARRMLVAAALNGKLYALGGTDTTGNTSGAVEAYDPSNNTWTSETPLPVPKAFLSATALNGLIYALTLTSVEIYDPVSDSWSTVEGMKTVRSEIAVDALDGRLWVAGGLTGGMPTSATAAFEALRPPEATWWSGNRSVATIAQIGPANALGLGTATIRARAGVIDCAASAQCGSLTVTASTTVVTTVGTTSITTTSAGLSGSVAPGGPAITERGFVYSLNSANPNPVIGSFNVVKLTVGGTTGGFSAIAAPLVPATTYVFRAFASITGSTFYGAPVLFASANLPARVFVSSTGSDAGDCATQTTPCRNLAAAIAQVAIDGEVIVLSTGEYDTAPILIGKGVKITSPSGTVALIRQPITVHAPGGRVILRGLTIKREAPISLTGIRVTAAGSVSVEDTTIEGWNNGLVLEATVAGALAGMQLNVANSTLRGNGWAILDASTIDEARGSISGSLLEGNSSGLVTWAGRHSVSGCSFIGNATAGLMASGGFVDVRHSEFLLNETGLERQASATVRISRSQFFGNSTGISGFVGSHGNNMIRGNGINVSGALTPIPEQ